MIGVVHQLTIGGLGMFVHLYIHQLLAVQAVEIIESCHASGLERSHGVQGLLDVSEDVPSVLDIRSDVMRGTANQL